MECSAKFGLVPPPLLLPLLPVMSDKSKIEAPGCCCCCCAVCCICKCCCCCCCARRLATSCCCRGEKSVASLDYRKRNMSEFARTSQFNLCVQRHTQTLAMQINTPSRVTSLSTKQTYLNWCGETTLVRLCLRMYSPLLDASSLLLVVVVAAAHRSEIVVVSDVHWKVEAATAETQRLRLRQQRRPRRLHGKPNYWHQNHCPTNGLRYRRRRRLHRRVLHRHCCHPAACCLSRPLNGGHTHSLPLARTHTIANNAPVVAVALCRCIYMKIALRQSVAAGWRMGVKGGNRQ
jgi:hypothetical protein